MSVSHKVDGLANVGHITTEPSQTHVILYKKYTKPVVPEGPELSVLNWFHMGW